MACGRCCCRRRAPIGVPRDRNAAFEPRIVLRATCLGGFGDKIISLCARGLTVYRYPGHLRELNAADASPNMRGQAVRPTCNAASTAWALRCTRRRRRSARGSQEDHVGSPLAIPASVLPRRPSHRTRTWSRRPTRSRTSRRAARYTSATMTPVLSGSLKDGLLRLKAETPPTLDRSLRRRQCILVTHRRDTCRL